MLDIVAIGVITDFAKGLIQLFGLAGLEWLDLAGLAERGRLPRGGNVAQCRSGMIY